MSDKKDKQPPPSKPVDVPDKPVDPGKPVQPRDETDPGTPVGPGKTGGG